MLVVLETLTPTERAVFVLREVFDVGYDEIADAVDKSPAAVRQIAHRARNHVEARQPREQVSARQREAILDRFVLAVESGDLQTLMDVLAPDVVLMTDGGGVKQAALRPILGRDKALRFLEGAATKGGPIDAVHRTLVNGRPGLAFVDRRRGRHAAHDPGRGRRGRRPLRRAQPGQAHPPGGAGHADAVAALRRTCAPRQEKMGSGRRGHPRSCDAPALR